MIWLQVGGTIVGVLGGIAGAIALVRMRRKPPLPPLPNIDVGVAFPVLMDGKEVEMIVDTIQGDFGAYGRQIRVQLQDAKSWLQERRV